MNQVNEHIVTKILNQIILEQTEPEQDNTDTETYSPFNAQEEKFLGKFDTFKSKHLGVIYSISDIGIREFISRSGLQLDCTAGLLFKLLRDKIIKIVPSSGYGRDTDYTIELQLSLEDVEGLGEDKADAPAAAAAGGAETLPPPSSPEAPPDLEGPPVEWITNYKDIIAESIKITNQIILERKSNKKKKSKLDNHIKIHMNKSRILQRIPPEFIYQLKRVIKIMSKKTYTKLDQERLIADILDTLQQNFKLSDKQIRRAFEFHKNQKRLQKYLEK